jgi:hypothetical protein
MSDSRSARATACVRVSASSLSIAFFTCDLTVSGEIDNRSATWMLRMPSASSRKTSRSRFVSVCRRSVACGPASSPASPGQIVERSLLEQEAARAGVQRLQQHRPVPRSGVEDDRRFGSGLRQTPRDLDPVRFRHPDVEDGHVRAEILNQLERAAAVGRSTDQLDVVHVVEEARHRVNYRRMVVGENAPVM